MLAEVLGGVATGAAVASVTVNNGPQSTDVATSTEKTKKALDTTEMMKAKETVEVTVATEATEVQVETEVQEETIVKSVMITKEIQKNDGRCSWQEIYGFYQHTSSEIQIALF